MASPHSKPDLDCVPDGTGLVVGVVSARWNADLVERLTDGAHRAISRCGAIPHVESAPGAFELPFAARVLAESGEVDAIVVCGVIVRGETTHYDLVSTGSADGVMDVQLGTGIPVGFGVLAVEDRDQALARSGGPGEHNVGEDAAFAAIEMAVFARRMLHTS